MSLRARLLLASTLVLIAPLLLLGFGIRREMTRRLSDVYEARVTGLVSAIENDLEAKRGSIGERLAALRSEMADDNTLRLAAVEGREEHRGYLLDYAERAMRLMGLSMLQIQDDAGRIVSSGHYRNEYDRLEPALPARLARAPGGASFVRARTPEGSFLALARVDSLRLGAQRFSIIGGTAVDEAFLAPVEAEEGLAVSILCDGELVSSDPAIAAEKPEGPWLARLRAQGDFVREIHLPFFPGSADEEIGEAVIVVSHRRQPLARILRDLEGRLLLALAVTAAGTLLLAAWMSFRISRPIRRLAEKAAGIDFDTLDARFESERKDEVGTLSRFLSEMLARLRTGAEKLRDTERRATLGELARQVHHDIRSGFTPIRNVIRHLAQLSRERPDEVAHVFQERLGTLESGLAYLDDLSKEYARLSAPEARLPVDVNDVAREVVAAAAGPEVEIRADLAPHLPAVLANRTGLRRVLENLVRNGRESLPAGGGTVSVETREERSDGEGRVVVAVRDTGRGIEKGDLSRVFDRFYTGKEGGTGLGLSIVRRLVTDFGGTIRIESEPGAGTIVTVRLPTAADEGRDL